MNPQTERGACGWYVETDWDYSGDSTWAGPFSSEQAALDYYFRNFGG